MSRPLVTVYSSEKLDGKNLVKQSSVALPEVFSAPIRTDIINKIHTFQSFNLRHPHGIFRYAAQQTAAESWGTGRAVSRIPRVTGSGTHRAGQGAFGNMCRGGRMFAPKKIWRRWAHEIKRNEKKFALAGAIAATSVTSLVMARGHRIDRVSEIPLVVSDDIQSYEKTKQAEEFLRRVKAYDDVEKVNKSRKQRVGKGKYRNRRYTQRKGPLVIYDKNNGLVKAFRNIRGVETMSVHQLNLLGLAPGGHVGRFVIWTESAFKELQGLFGSYTNGGDSKINKRGGVKYQLPRPLLTNTDIEKIINSESVQNVIRPTQFNRRERRKRNPLKNFYAMVKLNPYALTLKRLEVRKKAAKEKFEQKLKSKDFKPSKRVLKNRKLEQQKQDIHKKFFSTVFDFDKVSQPKTN